MKKIVAILLTVMLLAAVLPTASFAAAASTNFKKSTVYRVKATHGLTLRKGAGTKYKSLGTLANGTAFTVTKTSGSWYKIKVLKTGKVGWVSKKYTSKYAKAKNTTPIHGLNVRKGPNEYKYAIIDSIPRGAKNITVKYATGNWAYVKYHNLSGWASMTFLTWTA